MVYTMLTRGRHANHLYLQTIGDGDVHTVVRPETLAPRTPTETLEQILARDDAPTSASSQLRNLKDPAPRLYDAVQRYTDSLHVALEQLGPREVVRQLDSQADQIVPGLKVERSWPTLGAHFLKMAAENGEHPLERLQTAASWSSLHGSTDRAALLEWRLLDPRPPEPGPLPWLPGPPRAARINPTWDGYLTARSRFCHRTCRSGEDQAIQDGSTPAWAEGKVHLTSDLTGDIEVCRAAFGVAPGDRRPTGPAQLQREAGEWKKQLDKALAHWTGDISTPSQGRTMPRPVFGPNNDHSHGRHGQQPTRPVGPGR